MAENQKGKYLTKKVKFGGKTMVLYSLDGATWSTRREELEQIKERQEAQRVTLTDIKDEEAGEEEKELESEEFGGGVDNEEIAAPALPRGRPLKQAPKEEVEEDLEVDLGLDDEAMLDLDTTEELELEEDEPVATLKPLKKGAKEAAQEPKAKLKTPPIKSKKKKKLAKKPVKTAPKAAAGKKKATAKPAPKRKAKSRK